jgi:hypothetical protein
LAARRLFAFFWLMLALPGPTRGPVDLQGAPQLRRVAALLAARA